MCMDANGLERYWLKLIWIHNERGSMRYLNPESKHIHSYLDYWIGFRIWRSHAEASNANRGSNVVIYFSSFFLFFFPILEYYFDCRKNWESHSIKRDYFHVIFGLTMWISFKNMRSLLAMIDLLASRLVGQNTLFSDFEVAFLSRKTVSG